MGFLTLARTHYRGHLWLLLLFLGVGFWLSMEKRALSPIKTGTVLGKGGEGEANWAFSKESEMSQG